MSSRKGGGKTASAIVAPTAGNGSPSVKGKRYDGSSSGWGSPNIDQLNRGIADIDIGTTQQNDWEVIGKKSKNRGSAWGSSTIAPNAWGHSEGTLRQGLGSNSGAGRAAGNNWSQAIDSRRPAGRGKPMPQQSNRGWESAYPAPSPNIPPPLQHGWQWAMRGGSSGSQPRNQVEIISGARLQGEPVDSYGSESNKAADQENDHEEEEEEDAEDDDDELLEDSDDNLSDDYDSDASQKSHETRKKNKWLKPLFEALDSLTVEQINEQTRQWHCPACHDGPGAIDWYKGLQPLLTHAKTKGTTRVKLHRELAVLLEEELLRRGTSVIPAGEAFGKWKGLCETTTDREIVWPPMVVVMNTKLDKDENDKWIGMGNQELVAYFNTYAAVKSRHSYGPSGHRGMSVLIFEASAMGYLEAERLHKQFIDEGRDRDAWERCQVKFYPGGKRPLYGYLACKEDMDDFNQHSAGKSRLKYEMKSYEEMVVIPLRQMNEDSQRAIWYKNKAAKHEQLGKAYKVSLGVVSQKLREKEEESSIVRRRTMIQHEEHKEEMDFLEIFFKEQMDKIHKATEKKEQNFEKWLQEERAKAKQIDVTSGSNEDRKQREEELVRFIESQVKGVEEFEVKREKLIRVHEEKKVELKRKHLQEEVELEKDFDTAFTKLMQEYAPSTFQASSSS